MAPRFFNRSFLLLWQGQLVSQLGNQAFLIAATMFALEQTGSARVVSAVMAASVVPIVLLAPLGGTFADRYSRRALLVITDLFRALSVGGFGLFLIIDAEVASRSIPLLIAVALFGGAMSAIFAPTVQAFIPDLVPGERLAAANSLNQFSVQSAILVGQALGGLFYARWGAAALFVFDGISFAYAAAATAMLPRDPRPVRSKAQWSAAINRYAGDVMEAVRYVRSASGMAALVLLFTFVNFSFMPVFVLLPIYVQIVLDAGPEWYGFLLAASGAGALAGSVVAGMTFISGGRASHVAGMCVAGIATSVIILALTRERAAAVTAFVMVGALSSIINITVITAFQRAVPSEMRGRVMALLVALSTAAVPAGMAVGGILGDAWRESLPVVFAVSGVTMLIVAAAAYRLPELPAAARDV